MQINISQLSTFIEIRDSGDTGDFYFLFTWDEIAKTYGGHGHKTEVKSIKKIPIVLPQHKHSSSAGEIKEE